MSTNVVAPEADGLKTRLKAIWTAGDYDRFSRYMEGAHGSFMSGSRCRRGADCWTSPAGPANWP